MLLRTQTTPQGLVCSSWWLRLIWLMVPHTCASCWHWHSFTSQHTAFSFVVQTVHPQWPVPFLTPCIVFTVPCPLVSTLGLDQFPWSGAVSHAYRIHMTWCHCLVNLHFTLSCDTLKQSGEHVLLTNKVIWGGGNAALFLQVHFMTQIEITKGYDLEFVLGSMISQTLSLFVLQPFR